MGCSCFGGRPHGSRRKPVQAVEEPSVHEGEKVRDVMSNSCMQMFTSVRFLSSSGLPVLCHRRRHHNASLLHNNQQQPAARHTAQQRLATSRWELCRRLQPCHLPLLALQLLPQAARSHPQQQLLLRLPAPSQPAQTTQRRQPRRCWRLLRRHQGLGSPSTTPGGLHPS